MQPSQAPIPPPPPYPSPPHFPPRPKRRTGLIIGVITVVIILILGIVLADYFVFKKLIFKEEEKRVYTMSTILSKPMVS